MTNSAESDDRKGGIFVIAAMASAGETGGKGRRETRRGLERV